MRGSDGAAASRPDSARLRWLAIVIAIMAVLTAGWPLLSLAVTDQDRLAANSKLVVGPGHSNSAVVRVGPGWLLHPGESNPHLAYSLQRGPADMSIAYVTLVNNRQVSDLWAGLREVVQIRHPGASLSAPIPVVSIHGAKGNLGVVRAPDLVGTAAVFAGPSRLFAIEMVVVAPKGTARLNLVAAQRIVRSLLFPATVR